MSREPMRRTASILCLAMLVGVAPVAGAQQDVPAHLGDAGRWAADLINAYEIVPDVRYWTAGGFDLEVDVFVPAGERVPRPTLVYFHGGGWVGGSRLLDLPMLLPYLQRGWAVVNVDYRKLRDALAPAAVEDARCALRWTFENAEVYGFDPARIVTSGRSAGGHLALMAAFLDEEHGFDYACPGVELPAVAAVVSWFGIADVTDLLDGPNRKNYAIGWIGGATGRRELARRVSPLHHVRAGLPPVLSIHGDADRIAPYEHSVRLHEALKQAGVDNQLHTVAGGGHANFDTEPTLAAYATLWRFLASALEDLPTPARE